MTKQQQQKTIHITDNIKRHWTCACLAPLTKAEYETMTIGMKEFGQKHAGVVWPDPDGQLLIIDGFHRHKICQKLDIPFRAKVEPVDATEKQLLDVVLQNQFVRRENGATTSRAACEGIHIIKRAKEHGIKITQTALYEKYKGVLSRNSMSLANQLYKLNPDWFEIIRTGHKVEFTDPDNHSSYQLDGLEALIKKHAEMKRKKEALMAQGQQSNGTTDNGATIDPLYQEAEELVRKHLKMAVMTGLDKHINMPTAHIKNILLDIIQKQQP